MDSDQLVSIVGEDWRNEAHEVIHGQTPNHSGTAAWRILAGQSLMHSPATAELLFGAVKANLGLSALAKLLLDSADSYVSTENASLVAGTELLDVGTALRLFELAAKFELPGAEQLLFMTGTLQRARRDPTATGALSTMRSSIRPKAGNPISLKRAKAAVDEFLASRNE